MGLDITYGLMAPPALPLDEDDDCIDANGIYVQEPFNMEAFAERSAGIDLKKFVLINSGGFRAGSYIGYGVWRNWLAGLAGYRHTTEGSGVIGEQCGCDVSCWNACSEGQFGPLWELINFADNEGTIGPEVAGRLYDQMLVYKPAVEASIAPPHFKETFNNFLEAFRVAKSGGAVIFH